MTDEHFHCRMIHDLFLRSPGAEFNVIGDISGVSVVGEDYTIIGEILEGPEISVQDVLRSYLPSNIGSKGQHYGS